MAPKKKYTRDYAMNDAQAYGLADKFMAFKRELDEVRRDIEMRYPKTDRRHLRAYKIGRRLDQVRCHLDYIIQEHVTDEQFKRHRFYGVYGDDMRKIL